MHNMSRIKRLDRWSDSRVRWRVLNLENFGSKISFKETIYNMSRIDRYIDVEKELNLAKLKIIIILWLDVVAKVNPTL